MAATVRGISIDGRTGTFTSDTSREYSLIYKVVTDNRNDGPAVVRDAVGIPSIGSLYSAGNDFDPASVVVSKTATQVSGSPWEWEVEVTFSNDVETDPTQQVENPLDEPASISYGFVNRKVIVPGYFNSPQSPPTDGTLEQGIVTPAGELFVPQPEVEISEPILSISRNVSTISGPALMALANSVNSSPFFGADARQLKMMAPQATRNWHKASGFYWNVSYQFVYRYETHDVQILNQGTYYLDGSQKKVIFATTGEGVPYVGLLTSTGGKLADGADPTFTTLRVAREIDFNSLGLI